MSSVDYAQNGQYYFKQYDNYQIWQEHWLGYKLYNSIKTNTLSDK